jgi:PAS domain S-box-containing protein
MASQAETSAVTLARYRLAFDITPMPLVLVRPEGSIALGNREFDALFELDPGSSAGMRIEAFVPADRQEAHRQMREAYARSAERRQMGTGRDLFGVTRGGRRIPVEIGLHPIDIDGEIWTLASVLDISERRRFAQQLRSSKRQLETVLDTATNGIIGVAGEARVQIINPAARRMLGNTCAPLPFRWPEAIRFLDATDLAPLEGTASPVSRALAGERLEDEVFVLCSGGDRNHRYVRVSSAPAEEEDSPIRTVLVLDDVTEMEAKRQQFERAGRLDALGQLTGGIAHDFNNLLATILYGIELIEMQPQTERVRRVLQTTRDSITRGTSLTRRMLAFARRQPGLETSRRVTDVIADLFELAKPAIGEDIAFTGSVAAEDLFVYCDQAQLDNALLNLALNARDAIRSSGKGSRISIQAVGLSEPPASLHGPEAGTDAYIARGRRRDQAEDIARDDDAAYRYVMISVADDGPGMSPEVKRRAIDPFFTTKREDAGTGLGLSMVYGFVQQSGGELRIYSDLGAGTAVHLILRRGTPEGAREPPVRRSVPRVGSGERILVVEDEPGLLDTLMEMLEVLGFTPLSARTGREALDLAQGGAAFDLLLSDVVMPGGIGGFELARRLRALRPDLPVVYMSGYTGYTGEEMGEIAAPLLTKPCAPEHLARTLRDALDAAAR